MAVQLNSLVNPLHSVHCILQVFLITDTTVLISLTPDPRNISIEPQKSDAMLTGQTNHICRSFQKIVKFVYLQEFAQGYESSFTAGYFEGWWQFSNHVELTTWKLLISITHRFCCNPLLFCFLVIMVFSCKIMQLSFTPYAGSRINTPLNSRCSIDLCICHP